MDRGIYQGLELVFSLSARRGADPKRQRSDAICDRDRDRTRMTRTGRQRLSPCHHVIFVNSTSQLTREYCTTYDKATIQT